jgi:hypothetical protein
MDLVGLQVESANRLDDERGQQTGAVGLEEAVQSSTQDIIVGRRAGMAGWNVALGPFGDAIECVGFEQDAQD